MLISFILLNKYDYIIQLTPPTWKKEITRFSIKFFDVIVSTIIKKKKKIPRKKSHYCISHKTT